MDRREAMRAMSVIAGGGMLASGASGSARGMGRVPSRGVSRGAVGRLPILLSVKFGMVGGEGSIEEKFRLLKDLGYDGVEMDSPTGLSLDEIRAARDAVGLRIHGVVDSVHWNLRLSSPDEGVRRQGREALATAIRDSHAMGGSSVLLVPGRVGGEDETQRDVWQRSMAEIRGVLPIAADLGVFILIENVWNGFCYTHDGAADQTAHQLAAYIDAIGSPWVGSYFDIGNHRKYGDPAAWIRTLGKRIVKLDVKDWSFTNGWTKIGEGDVPWEDVRAALGEIGFTGWATAEVGGGDRERLREIRENMRRVFALDVS